MRSRFPKQPATAEYRPRKAKNVFGCQSLALPCSEVSFVDSDSDEEWSKNRTFKPNTTGGTHPPKPEAKNSPRAIEPRQGDRGVGIKAVQNAATKGLSVVLSTQLCDVAVKLLWLSVFHSAASKPAQIFEFSTFLGPPLMPVCQKLARRHSKSELPNRVAATADFLKSCRIPAGISIAFRLATLLRGPRWGNERRGQNLVLTPIEGEGLRQTMASMTPSIQDLYCRAQERKPSTTLEAAEIYRSVIHLFKCTLDWQPLHRCRKFAIRFDNTDAEIMRYLLACNLLEARTEDEVEHVFEDANRRIQDTLNWATSFEFVRDSEIKNHWSDYVCWTLRLESGHPVLLMRLGAATRCCDGPKAEEYGRAVISQVDRGVRKLLRNNGIDKLVTIVDCQGATAFNVNKFLALLRTIPLDLNRHYPGRLEALHLVNVPGFVIWVIQLIKRFLHPATREKIRLYNDDVSTFPPEVAEILQNAAERRETVTEGSSSQVG